MKASFGIIGGDKRQLYLGKSIKNDGFKVYICGFELSSDTDGLEEVSLAYLVEKCDNIILPLPCTKDGVNIFAPYSSMDICISQGYINKIGNKNIYGGYINKLTSENPNWEKVNIEDYYLREELAISNAVPTAEGAIAIAIQEYPDIINKSNCLITGYGRIGKVLTKDLLALGANVDVAARKKEDFAMIKAMGAQSLAYKDIKKTYDIIFNTVPEIVINSQILSRQDSQTIIIELATLPGGIDRKIASLSGVKVYDAQSLPGKVAPKATGEFIKETIYNIMEEKQC